MCAAYYYSGGTSTTMSPGGNPISNSCIVTDIGSYATKIGWAGDDYPRAYFRSNVAVRRHNNYGDDDYVTTNEDMDIDNDDNNPAATTDTNTNRQQQNNKKHGKGRIVGGERDIKYDYFVRSIVKHNPTTNEYDDGDYEVCNPVDASSGLFYQSLNSNAAADEESLIPDWYDLVSNFIHHTYNTSLLGSKITDHPMIFTERAYNIPSIRQQIVECLFEELQLPAVFLAKDAVLQCYGVGKTSATSIDFGYSGTTVAPVCDGYVENVGIQRSPIGVRAMDELILQQLDRLYTQQQNSKHPLEVVPLYQVRRGGDNTTSRRNESIHTAARLFLAQECRENGAGAAINTTLLSSTTSGSGAGGATTSTGASGNVTTAPKTTFHAPSIPFDLPDGTIIDIPSADRFRAVDYLYGNNVQMFLGGSTTETIHNRRQQIYEQTKSHILSYCSLTAAAMKRVNATQQQQAAAAAVSRNVVPASEQEQNDEHDAIQKQLQQQDRAAAVGIVSRQQKEVLQKQKRTTGSIATAIGSNQTYEKYVNWHRSCLLDLQTLAVDQLTSNSIAAMVCDSAYKCDRDQQATLLSNIVVGGGGSTFGPTEQAVPDGIKDSIEKLIHTHTPGWRVKIYTPTANTERSILSWLGGSILGSINTFPTMYITQQEYNEWGSAIVNRKCP